VRRYALSMWAVAFGLAASALSGCTLGSSSQSPISHFAFPSSNIIPIGPAHGQVSKLCGILFVTWSSPDSDDLDEATRQALESTNGDLLINIRTDSKVFTIPMIVSVCTTKVRGTSCKTEVGRQVIPVVTAAPPPPLPPPPPPPQVVVAPAPASAPAPMAAPPARPNGCTSNDSCKAGRICRDGKCVNP